MVAYKHGSAAPRDSGLAGGRKEFAGVSDALEGLLTALRVSVGPGASVRDVFGAITGRVRA